MLFRFDHLLAGTACALLALGAGSARAAPSPSRVLSYPATGVVLGQGWDSQGVQSTTGSCVVFATAQGQVGQTVHQQRTLVSDAYGYSSALNVSADVQVKSMTGASVDAKASYANSRKFNSTYMTVVDLVSVDDGWTYAAPAAQATATRSPGPRTMTAARPLPAATALTPPPAAVTQQMRALHQANAIYFQNVGAQRTARQRDAAFAAAIDRMYAEAAGPRGRPGAPIPLRAAPLPPPPPGAMLRGAGGMASLRLTDDAAALAQSNPDKFRQLCGDSFVSAINDGGELAATYTFMTTSQEQQTEIGAALGVSYGSPVANASATVSVAQALGSWGKNISTSVDYYRSGGSGAPIPTDLAGIDTQVQAFAGQVAAKPYHYKITVTDYRQLSNYPTGSVGMPPITGFQRLAWEYGKAQTLYDTVSQVISDLNDPQQARRYLTARWGSTPADLDRVQRLAGQRMSALRSLAPACMAAAPANAAAACATTDFDDLTPRAVMPLPIGAGNVSDVVNGLWNDPAAYRNVVFKRWIGDVNDNRCWANPGDETYCKYADELTAALNAIKATAPGFAALELVDLPGQCLNYGTLTTYMSAQPCPSSPSEPGFFMMWDPKGGQLSAALQGDCIYAMRTPQTTPGFAVVGLATCGVTSRSEDISHTWTFRDAPDGTGAYLVVSDADTPAQLNSCLDSYSPTSTWIAPCSHPKRVRVWMTKPAS